jgi:hypothetical protein
MALPKKEIKKSITLILFFTITMMTTLTTANIADAASLLGLSDSMSNQTISSLSSHSIKYTAVTPLSSAGRTIVITFPSGFDFTSKTISSLTFTHGPSTGAENVEPLLASPTTAAWGAVFSGSNNVILTLTTPTDGVGTAAVAANDKVIITYDSTNSLNPSSAASYTISITSNTDTGSITVPIITNSQVAVSATIAEQLSFNLSSSSIGFGTLSPSSTQYANAAGTGSTTEPSFAHTITASTNGSSGYVITLSGPTLTSGANTIAPIPGAVAASLTPGVAQFGIRTTASGGIGTINAPFNGAAGNYGFGTSPLSSQTFAIATGPTPTTTYDVNYASNISISTPAGSYATTLTYVATANF